ncbi:MAG: SPOR domain-containing protein [Bacteroidales bacterium]|nr:SPOR domain-containing protein [Bacteroidales bacterium]
MNISESISELLYEYECVVLPDFGGFITNDKPARWNRLTHQFDPPYKEVLFNVQLKANDGLLVNYLAEKGLKSYKAARQELAGFVNECRSELASGKRVAFPQIGTLSLDKSGHVVFEQDYQTNYNPDAFGLNSLVSPAIKRTSSEEKIKGLVLPATKTTKRPDRKPGRSSEEKKSGRRKTAYRFPLTIAGMMLLVVLITSVFFPWPSSPIHLNGLFSVSHTESRTDTKTNRLRPESPKTNEAGFLPAGDAQLETVEVLKAPEPSGKNQAGKESPAQTVAESEWRSEPAASETKNEFANKATPAENKGALPAEAPEPTTDKSKVKIQPAAKRYYIIAGSFREEENARKLVVQLTGKGYSAIVADTNTSGMYRVAYAGFYKWADAKQELLAIRQEENAQAWVLKK